MPQVKPVACRRAVNSLLRALSMAPPISSPYNSCRGGNVSTSKENNVLVCVRDPVVSTEAHASTPVLVRH
jgi:hypothetical protein